MSNDSETSLDTFGLTLNIVSAFVGNNSLQPQDLPGLIVAVHAALGRLSSPDLPEPAPTRTPAVPVRRSVTPDYLVCLDDGKRFKSLKRHLRSKFGLTPEEYRARWNLPPDYPMVAPNYAAERSKLAKASGLGRDRRAANNA